MCPRRAIQVRDGASPHPCGDGADVHERHRCRCASTPNDETPCLLVVVSRSSPCGCGFGVIENDERRRAAVSSIVAVSRVAICYKFEFRIVGHKALQEYFARSRGKQQEW